MQNDTNDENDNSIVCNILHQRYNDKIIKESKANSVVDIDNNCITDKSSNLDSKTKNIESEESVEGQVTCINNDECDEVNGSRTNKIDKSKEVCVNEQFCMVKTLHMQEETFMPYLYGYTFSSTLLSCAEREALQRILNKNGAVLSSSLSTSCDALLINDDTAKLLRRWVKCNQAHEMEADKRLSSTNPHGTRVLSNNVTHSSHQFTSQTAVKTHTTCQRSTNCTLKSADNSVEFAPSEKIMFAWKDDIPVISYYRLFALAHVVMDLDNTTTTNNTNNATTDTTNNTNGINVTKHNLINRCTVNCANLHNNNETSILHRRQLDFDTIADTFSIPAPQLNDNKQRFDNEEQSNQHEVEAREEEEEEEEEQYLFTELSEEFTSSEEDCQEELEMEEEEEEQEWKEEEQVGSLEQTNVTQNKQTQIEEPIAPTNNKRVCHDATRVQGNETEFTLSLHDAIPEEANTLHVHNADEYMSLHDERKDYKSAVVQIKPFTELTSSSSSSSSTSLLPCLFRESHAHSDHAADYFSMP